MLWKPDSVVGQGLSNNDIHIVLGVGRLAAGALQNCRLMTRWVQNMCLISHLVHDCFVTNDASVEYSLRSWSWIAICRKMIINGLHIPIHEFRI